MDPFDENRNPIIHSSSSVVKLLPVLLIGMQVLISLVTYPFLPAVVPSHWNAVGQVDGYLPKLDSAILFPAISIVLYIVIRFFVAAAPNPSRNHKQSVREFVEHILPFVMLLLLIVQLAATAIAFGMPVDMMFVVSLFISLLFVGMGNYLGQVRRNYWAGIRTPWTLANDTVWERTNRVGGWLFVAVGLLGIVMSFIPGLRIWGVIGLMLLEAVYLYVYSYIVYKRVRAGGV